MFVMELFFATAFYDNIGTFMAFIGIFIAPMVGVQIVDWLVLGRIDRLHLPSLFRHDARSRYWYRGGINPAGFVALALGALTYVLLLNPITFEPNASIVQYTTASLPAVVVGGLTYYIAMKLFGDIHPETGRAD